MVSFNNDWNSTSTKRRNTEKLKLTNTEQKQILKNIHFLLSNPKLSRIFYLNPERLMIPYNLKNAIKKYVLILTEKSIETNNIASSNEYYTGLIIVNNSIYHIDFNFIIDQDEHGRTDRIIILNFKTALKSFTIETGNLSYLKECIVSLFNFHYYQEKYRLSITK